MTLDQVEKRLAILRKEEGVTFKELGKHGLKRETVIRIHEGKDYNISSLFRYLDALMYVIEINGILCADIETFGNILHMGRQSSGLSLVQIQSKLVWTARQVYAIEKGRGYSRSSLVKYTDVIKANYDLVSVFDLSSEIREALFKNI